jgi:hypothetical protein
MQYICAEINNDTTMMKEGEKAKVSPKITGQPDWVEGVIIKVRKNPFLGVEVAVKDNLGRIFFGEAKYFQPA